MTEKTTDPAAVRASGEPQKLLNGWIELGEELSRVIGLMPADTFAEWFPDWFGSRLFDLQVLSAAASASDDGAARPQPAQEQNYCPRCSTWNGHTRDCQTLSSPSVADSPTPTTALELLEHIQRGHSPVKREHYIECSCGTTFWHASAPSVEHK